MANIISFLEGDIEDLQSCGEKYPSLQCKLR